MPNNNLTDEEEWGWPDPFAEYQAQYGREAPPHGWEAYYSSPFGGYLGQIGWGPPGIEGRPETARAITHGPYGTREMYSPWEREQMPPEYRIAGWRGPEGRYGIKGYAPEIATRIPAGLKALERTMPGHKAIPSSQLTIPEINRVEFRDERDLQRALEKQGYYLLQARSHTTAAGQDKTYWTVGKQDPATREWGDFRDVVSEISPTGVYVSTVLDAVQEKAMEGAWPAPSERAEEARRLEAYYQPEKFREPAFARELTPASLRRLKPEQLAGLRWWVENVKGQTWQDYLYEIAQAWSPFERPREPAWVTPRIRR